MNSTKRLLQKALSDDTLTSETQVLHYVEMTKKQIIKNHEENVFPIKSPGERGGDKNKWFTKLTPKNRNHDGKIRANSREELEEKILNFYLEISNEEKMTCRDVLIKAIDTESKTGKRTLQRFDKRLKKNLEKVKIGELNKNTIYDALDAVIKSKVTKEEFKGTLTALYKIADYCEEEEIETCNIRAIVDLYKKKKFAKKHIFLPKKNQVRDLAFNKKEASIIVNFALKYPNFKALAVATLITTGVRVGELLALKISDINLEERYIFLHQMEDTKTNEILDYIKENKCRTVYLSDEAVVVLQAVLKLRCKEVVDNDFVFLNSCSKDNKLHLRVLDYYLRKTVHKSILGLDSTREARSTHDCRRTYASLAYIAGMDIYTICKQLGHADISMTEKYIKQVADAEERKNLIKNANIIDLTDLDAVGRNEKIKKEA